ncbi:MAGE-domain-containing protein [Pisolithus marmoratus]|nr:MAGE-domain-containing protein [Pisolithus marmoratus]
MSRAGPSQSQRSQRAPQPSQYHSKRATRRGRKAQAREEEEEEEEEPVAGDENIEMQVDTGEATRDSELDRKASDLARLALFMEQKRIPLRREDINKKVLGSNTRQFKAVFQEAQILLQKTFGMELVELQSRNYREEDLNEDARNATGVKKKGKCPLLPSIHVLRPGQHKSFAYPAAAGSRTYILRSVLDPVIIEQAAITDERLFEEQMNDAPDEEGEEDLPRLYGSVISWSTCDQLASLGILYVVLALILVNGRTISDVDLKGNLKRLRLPSNAVIPVNTQAAHKAMPIDAFLNQLMRQGYLDCIRPGDNKVAGGKRGRAPAATQVAAEDNQAYEWRWGSRAHSEVGEQAIASFMAEFMVERSRDVVMDDDEEQEVGTSRRGRGQDRENTAEKKLENMQKAIERAAGGNLSGTN